MNTEATVETRAYAMGWRPLDQFRGDPERWVDAETFLRKGEEVMPILKANNHRLETQLEETRRQLAETRTQLESVTSNMGEFLETQKEILKEKLTRQRSEILAQMKVARDDGDVAAEADLQEQLDEVREQRKTLDTKPAKQEKPAPAPTQPADPPELRAWRERNPWFGGSSREDSRKTALAMQIGKEAAERGLVGTAFLEYIDQELESLSPSSPPTDKTESGRPSGRSSSSSASTKGYKDLPADAKAACDADSKRFVGPNKMFKDTAAWQKHYADLYFQE